MNQWDLARSRIIGKQPWESTLDDDKPLLQKKVWNSLPPSCKRMLVGHNLQPGQDMKFMKGVWTHNITFNKCMTRVFFCWFNPPWKISVKLNHLPKDDNKKSLKPPARFTCDGEQGYLFFAIPWYASHSPHDFTQTACLWLITISARHRMPFLWHFSNLKREKRDRFVYVGCGWKKVTQTYPDAPCMDYLPTLGEKWSHSRGNVGEYSLHGAFGIVSPIVIYHMVKKKVTKSP